MTSGTNSTATTDKTGPSEVDALRQEVALLKHQNDWFRKQLFGSKSEKRLEECPDQLRLFGKKQAPDPDERLTQKISYERGKGKKLRDDECVSEHGLRFDEPAVRQT